jgi:hypothetical protein
MFSSTLGYHIVPVQGHDENGRLVPCLAKTRLARRRFTPAAAVPISFDAMASRRITMHRCHKPEKTAIGCKRLSQTTNSRISPLTIGSWPYKGAVINRKAKA